MLPETYLLVASNIGFKTESKKPVLTLAVLLVVSLIFQNFSFVYEETSTLFEEVIFDPMYDPALFTPNAAVFPNHINPPLRNSPPFLI